MRKTTKPEVFIIESLKFDDENNELFEGRIISQILALSDKKCKYYYVRTKRELEKVLKIFSSSQYRYLHLSCHGGEDEKTMHTTLDAIPYTNLSRLLKPHLRKRRLFVSACSMTNESLAKCLMPKSGCISILGPEKTINFNDAAIFWASLYHVLFSVDSSRMNHTMIQVKAKEVASMYRVRLNYIRRNNSITKGYSLTSIAPAKEKAAK